VAPTVLTTASATGVPAGTVPVQAATVPPMVQAITPLDTQEIGPDLYEKLIFFYIVFLPSF